MLELLSLIETALNSRLPEITPEREVLSNYEIFYPADPRNLQESVELGKLDPRPVEKIIIPDFIKCQPNEPVTLEDGFFETIDSHLFATYETLAQNSQNSNTGQRNLKFDKELFSKLVALCKLKKVKLNSIFEILLCMAYQKVLDFFSNNEPYSKHVEYFVTINTRPFLAVPVPNTVMNVWMSRYMSEMAVDFEESTEFWENKIWDLSREKTQNLHKFIEDKKATGFYDNKAVAKSVELEVRGFRYLDVMYNFCLSNIGIQKNHLEDVGGELRVIEYYPGISFALDSNFYPIFIGTCSIDSSSFWSFTYNRSLIKDSVVNKLAEFMDEYISKIASFA
jgi:hypothetical protein